MAEWEAPRVDIIVNKRIGHIGHIGQTWGRDQSKGHAIPFTPVGEQETRQSATGVGSHRSESNDLAV